MSEWMDLPPYGDIPRQFNPETGMFRAELGGKPVFEDTMLALNAEIDTFTTRMAQAARRKLPPVHVTLLLETRLGFTLWEGDVLGLSASNKSMGTVRVRGEKPDAQWGVLYCLTPGDTTQVETIAALVNDLDGHLTHVRRLRALLKDAQRSLRSIRVPFMTRVDEVMEQEPDFLTTLQGILNTMAQQGT